jgi:hypothetical protein
VKPADPVLPSPKTAQFSGPAEGNATGALKARFGSTNTQKATISFFMKESPQPESASSSPFLKANKMPKIVESI